MTSIRRQLVVSLIVGLAAVLALVFAALYAHVRGALVGQFDAELVRTARLLAQMTVVESDGSLETEYHEFPLPEFQPSPDAACYALRQLDGTPVLRSPSLGTDELPWPEEVAERPAFRDVPLPGGRRGRAVYLAFSPRPDEDDGPPGNPLQLAVARPRTPLDAALGWLLLAFAAAGVALPLGVALVARWAVRRGLAPLVGVAEATRAIEADDLAYRFPAAQLPDELRPIGERLNELLARLQSAFERERRFTRDVAHELRTPLAELRALAEVGRQAAEGPTEEYFADALEIAGRMEALVATLLALARGAADRGGVAKERVDLACMLREVWRKHEAQVRERGLHLRLDLPDAAPVCSNPVLLEAIVDNLVSNAARYTPEGGEIDCHLRAGDGRVVVTLANTNRQLSHEDLPHIFEPFWRKDAARADAAHAGLGLAIVADYAERLGIGLSADMPSPARFEVRLEIDDAQP